MSIKCIMNGFEVNYPCSPVCALFGDCVTAFEKQKKASVRTNADRIRAMSDEELAEDYCKFLNAMLSKVAFKYKLDFEYDMEKGKSIMLKYLQQPEEGECP